MGCGHFNPRPPCGGRPTERCCGGRHFIFQSTSSVWRTTFVPAKRSLNFGISIHVLRVEDDPELLTGGHQRKISIHVLRVEDDTAGRAQVQPHRISIHVLRVEDDQSGLLRSAGRQISIHVLRVEDDSAWATAARTALYFNPRPPCGGRQYSQWAMVGMALFQSTSSVWRTTQGRHPAGHHRRISIHVLRVEDDLMLSPPSAGGADFNPRPPCGGRRASVPAFCRGSDFNPRPPCGGRLWRVQCKLCGAVFQSTSSVWRTTKEDDMSKALTTISIHVLRVEDDTTWQGCPLFLQNFNPRPPCGGRPRRCTTR